MVRPLLALLALLALVVGACSSDEEPRVLESLPQVERTVPSNPDREAAEVELALTSVDPCQLFSREAARRVGDDVTTLASAGPHACRIGSEYTTTITLGTESTGNLRYHQGRHEAAGAVSYRTTTTKRDCSVLLPVSHDVAIEVRSFDRPCADTVRYAEGASRLLQEKPRSVQRAADDPGRFTACALLDEAMSDGTARAETAYSFSDCLKASDNSDAAVRLILESGSPIADEEGARDLDGIPATVDQVEDQCWVRWEIPGAAVPRAGEVARGRLVTDTCARARKLLPAVAAATRRTPPSGSPSGLLLPWEDGIVNDIAGVGACADIANEEALECAPVETAETPDNPFDLIEQGAADPEVLCAATTPIVREHLGSAMSPATTLAVPREGREGREIGTQCAFGEPSHAVHVTVRVSTGHVASPTSDQEVAGHVAEITEPREVEGVVPLKRFQIAHRADHPGGLILTVWVTPSRELGNWQGIEVDDTPIRASDALASDLAESLL